MRCFGAKIADGVHVYPSVKVSIPWNLEVQEFAAIGDRVVVYALGPIQIGARATISQGVHLCAGTHDTSRSDRPLVKSSITIGPNTWVAADAFIGPGVVVGDSAIVGARAVVVKEVAAGDVVAGNPAKSIRKAI